MLKSVLRRVCAVPLAIALTAAGLAVVAGPVTASVLPGAGQYTPLTPARIVARQSVAAQGTYTFSPLGLGGIPTSGVSAVALTMTARSTGSGHVIAFPAGGTRPGTSNLNYSPDISTTNSVTLRLGTGGQLSVFNAGTTTAMTLWVDVVGYYTTSAAAGAGSTYVGLTPARILPATASAPGAPLLVSPLGKGGVPSSNVSAVVVNIIVRGNNTVGEAVAYPEGVTRPLWTAVFYQGDFVYNNQVAVKLGTGGRFRLYTSTSAEVTIDVVGYFQAPTGTAAGGSFVGTDPQRVGPVIVGAGTTYTFGPLGQGGIPASGVSAVAFNLTATQGQGNSTLTVFPAGIALPSPANQLAYRTGPWPTQQYVKVGTNGQVSIHNHGTAQIRLLIDLLGYYRAAAAPGAPSGLTGKAANGAVTLSWTRPATDGGASITGYRVTANPGGQSIDTIDVTTITFAGLTNGSAYTFTVAARNAVGWGPPGAASAVVVPRVPTAPGAPVAVTAQARHQSAVVRWQRPDDGGLALTRYTVTATPGGASTTVTAPNTEATVSGLTNGTAYTFAVTATNDAGTGPGGRSATVVPLVTVPDAPRQVVAGSAGNGTISVGWLPPRYAGGSALAGYTLTVQPGNRTIAVGATVTETDVTGLTNGALYTIAVTARNATGTGPQSTPSKPVRPDLRLTPQARQLTPAALATITSFGTSRLVFTDAPAEVRDLTAGTFIVAYPGERVPDGFIRKVLSVATSGDATTVTTENALPSDAIEAGSFSMEAELADGSGLSTLADVGATITVPVDVTLGKKFEVEGTISVEVRVGFRHDEETGDTLLTLNGSLTQEFSVSAGEKNDPLKVRKVLKETDIKAARGIKFLKPTVNAEIYVWAEGSVAKDTTLSLSSTETIGTEVNINDLGSSTFSAGATGEVKAPTFHTAGNLKIGAGIDLIGQYAILNAARLKAQTYADHTLDPLGNPPVKVEGCLRIGVEGPTVLGKVSWKNDDLFKSCPGSFKVDGTVVIIPITPSDASVSRGGTFTFKARNPIPLNLMRWSVEGEGNGSIDGGVYTAPDKDGVFTIKVETEQQLGMPAMSGRATIRVGTPLAPTVTLATTTPNDGFNRVRITITAASGSPPADGYTAFVVPNYAPYSRCYGYWVIPGAGSYTLIDRNNADPTYGCDQLPTGKAVKFEVVGFNTWGESPPAESNQVTVTG